MIPSSTSRRSKIGHWCRKRRYSSGVQKPMTCSTPARLYQLRSNSTISPAAGRCGDVALEVPLAALALGRRGQRGDARDARVQVLGDPLDRAALAGGVAALEHDHDARARSSRTHSLSSRARPAGAGARASYSLRGKLRRPVVRDRLDLLPPTLPRPGRARHARSMVELRSRAMQSSCRHRTRRSSSTSTSTAARATAASRPCARRPRSSEYRRDFIAPGKCNDLVDFLERTVKMVSLMQSESALRTVTEDLFAQLAADDVAYAELRFAPSCTPPPGSSRPGSSPSSRTRRSRPRPRPASRRA